MPQMPGPRAASIAPARRCAYAVLRRVFERGAYADRAFQAEAEALDARDRGLAMRLAYGSVQRRGTLDHLIERLADRPAARLDPAVLAALRLGLYELLYLRSAPDYAVVADAVELARASGSAGHGLVNAVLRRAGREGAGSLLGALGDDTPERAAIKHSHPEWIARLWWQALGADQARALMALDNEPAELALRANTLVTRVDALARELPARTHRDALLPEALVVEEPFDVRGSTLWRDGAFLAQSRGAMLVSRALAPAAGERVLDLCAAPGGKTTHLAALMQGRGEIVAVERNARRADELARTARRLRAGNVRVEVRDAARPRLAPGAAGANFDRVLVDPPCSGLGTLQARADLRWRVTPDGLAEMAQAQAHILSAGAAVLRPGGVLVYSTCTISPTENEQLIDAFLDSRPDFAVDELPEELRSLPPPGVGAPETRSSRRGGYAQTLPHRDGTAGFFIARLRRI
jgi:16S rRNA (cytosine967-C5)-methyltransferase